MAIWKSGELEAVFVGPLDERGLTELALIRLVTDQISESDILEFKRDLVRQNPSTVSGWTIEQEFAKDICQFANARGGLVIFGVESTGGIATSLRAMTIQDIDAEERRLRQGLRNHRSPFCEVSFIWIAASAGGYFLAIVVPPSRNAPHSVNQPRGESRVAYSYPLRHGPGVIWMTEPEIAGHYRRRFDAIDDQRRRFETVVASGTANLKNASGIWQYIALGPDSPAPGRLNQEFVESTSQWFRDNRPFFAMQGSTIPAFGRAIAAPGRVTFTGSISRSQDDESVVHEAYVEFHVDGSGYAAMPISTFNDDDARYLQVIPYAIFESGVLMTDLLTRWVVQRSGSWGSATAAIGLVEPKSGMGMIVNPIALVSDWRSDRVIRISGTREVTGLPRFDSVLDLMAVDGSQQRLSVAYFLLSGLLQWFGLAEPAELNANGEIRLISFPPHQHQLIREWCNRNGVAMAAR